MGVEAEEAEEVVVVEAVRSVVLARAWSSAFSASVIHISATCVEDSERTGNTNHNNSGFADSLSLLGDVLLTLWSVSSQRLVPNGSLS